MKKVIFITFDFGLKGDYENFYKWLDENNAVERGYCTAYIKEYVTKQKFTSDREFVLHIKNEIKEKVKIGSNDRIYMIWNGIEDVTKIRSGFLFGSEKQAPWTGFSKNTVDDLKLDF